MCRASTVAVIVSAVLIACTPVAAQSSLWSATMTTGEFVHGDGATSVGYADLTWRGSSRDPVGALSDVDFVPLLCCLWWPRSL